MRKNSDPDAWGWSPRDERPIKKTKKKRRTRKKIHGNDRAMMMLARDVRLRWLQYGENRKGVEGKCAKCHRRIGTQIDHVEPLGPRPRQPEEFCTYIRNMFYRECQILCKKCHKEKTNAEREKRKNTVC